MSKKAKITVHPSFAIGDISQRIFGSFLEPIGTIVNGTMYNPKHPTADEKGFRHDVIDGLKNQTPACRLPGGNFVSCWDWKDSIGPKEKRKTHLDLAWKQYIDNEVGHDEYLQWAEAIETEPMYTINLGTGDIRDAIAIVEYTNHEGGTYWSDLRKENGHPDPYGVKVWYLGNEMDGPWQLGSWDKDPKGYGIRVNEISKAIKWVDPTIETVACASSSCWMEHYPWWEETVLEQCYETVDYISLHHYHAAPAGDLAALLAGNVFYEDFINTEIALCDVVKAKMRSPKQMMISFDEYGTMIRPCETLHPGLGPHNMAASHYVFDPNQKYIRHDPDHMEDRIFPGGDILHVLTLCLTLFTFIRHADRVKIACMTGGLAALLASNHDHVWKAAMHYAFRTMIDNAKGLSMQTAVDCDTYNLPGYAINDTSQYADRDNIPFIDSVTAYDENAKTLNIFVVNRSWEDNFSVDIDIHAFEGYQFIDEIEIACDDIDARNTYEEPDTILPVTHKNVKFRDGILTAEVKKLSFQVFRFTKNN